MYDLLIIGGGAAGFFTAINTAEKHPNFKIVILEKSKEVLHKVRISGQRYFYPPRTRKELSSWQ